MPTLISAAVWVPQGASARNPRRQDLSDPAELERVERLGKVKLDQARKDLEDELDRMQLDENSLVNDEEDDDEEERESLDLKDGDDEEDDEDTVAKARKMQATIKRDSAAKAAGENTALNNDEDIDKLYKLDDYDKEVSQTASLGVFSTIRGLAFHPGGSEADPYVTLEDPAAEDAELEREELEILPTDNLVVCAKTADDVSLLETHVYENYEDDAGDSEAYDGGNLYAHHDALLPAMPLCLEWGDCRPSTSKGDVKGSFIAVGTMDKHIEIWDLDVVDGLIPEAILGDDSLDEAQRTRVSGALTTGSGPHNEDGAAAVSIKSEDESSAVDFGGTLKKKKKKKKPKHSQIPEPLAVLSHAHTDSVLSLAWNRVHRSLLASASADSTVKLWDLQSPTCQRAIRSFQLHGEQKVQSVSWNPVEATVLLSGAWGGGIKVFDSRAPESSIGCQLLLDADVEALHWDPHSAGNAQFYAASGKGQILYWDSRHLSKAVWTLDAHDGPVSALDVNDFVPGCIVTGGIDKQVKVWSIINGSSTQKPSGAKSSANASISLVHSRDFGVGKVFCANWSPDDPALVCLAGSAAKLNVWDAFTNPGFRRTFGERLKNLDASTFGDSSRRARGNGIVALQDDNDAYETDDE